MKRIVVLVFTAVVLLAGSAAPAFADHTNPRERLSETEDPGSTELITTGEGTWEFIRNFPPNPGTDIKLFRKKGRLFAVTGTLGQANEQHVGQRFIRLINLYGLIKPMWRADHGSANCPTANPSGTTGLQHDQTVTPKRNPVLMIDTTDANGRCHDPGGGGLEIVDISRLHKKKFQPREIHLTRQLGTSHTVTLDATRPWIVYNSASAPAGQAWIDVLDIRSCLKAARSAGSLKDKRKLCRPKVSRIAFQPEWAQRIDASGEKVEGSDSSCHDITAKPGRIYCANANSTIVLDVKNLTTDSGAIRGSSLKCKLLDGTNTGAKVTDCADPALEGGLATGWKYVGHVNHAGRNGSHNTNTEYESTENIAVSHEAEPTPDNKWMFVTDERGGGIVPGGASCSEAPNPYGNGGVHVFDISEGGEYQYALDPDGNKAVFIGDVVVPSPTFCTAHVMEQIPGEQRFSIAWYNQGTKIVDWFVNAENRWTFRETASAVPQGPPATTWTSLVFKIKNNDDGTRTYYFISSDVSRGIDVFSWTGPANPMGTPPPAVPAGPI